MPVDATINNAKNGVFIFIILPFYLTIMAKPKVKNEYSKNIYIEECTRTTFRCILNEE